MNIFCPPYPPSFYQYWSTFPQGQTIASIIIESSCVILRNAHGLADKMPPCPPENREKPGEAAALHPWGYGVPGDGEGRCGPGGGGVWRRGPSPPAAKQKAGAGGFATAPAFQGALRPAAAPPRKPRRDSLSAGNVADAPRKRGASAKTPPGDGSKPNIPPFGNVAHGLPLCQQIQQEAFHAVPVGDPQLAQTHVLHQVN